jgi:hypothetical protein
VPENLLGRQGTSRTQLETLCGEVVVANLYQGTLSVTAGHAIVWHWSFKTTAGPPGFQQHGNASSIDDAKAAVEQQWTRWLAAARDGHLEWRASPRCRPARANDPHHRRRDHEHARCGSRLNGEAAGCARLKSSSKLLDMVKHVRIIAQVAEPPACWRRPPWDSRPPFSPGDTQGGGRDGLAGDAHPRRGRAAIFLSARPHRLRRLGFDSRQRAESHRVSEERAHSSIILGDATLAALIIVAKCISGRRAVLHFFAFLFYHA